MMWELPLSFAIIMFGLFVLQNNHYLFKERDREYLDSTASTEEQEKFKKEFSEYKKRVDALTLKAGFKL